MTLKGHEGDVLYKFEDNGFDSSPSDTTYKVLGGNVRMDTFEGSHQAVRVFNADRHAAQVIKQVFDGAWSITGELTEPPWWLQGIYGSPTSTNVSGSLYDHEYGLDKGGSVETLRLYAPTTGFDPYVLGGCAIAQFSITQSLPNNPEFSISGAYASEPTQDSNLSPTVPSFAERTFHNREASIDVGGTTVSKAQEAQMDLDTGTELVGEIGAGNMVDFVPGGFEPDPTYSKYTDSGQSVNLHDKFIGASTPGDQVEVILLFDNGESGDSTYKVQFKCTGSFPNSWSETGRNDPDAVITEELSDIAEDMTATITEDQSAPPT